MKEPIEEPVVSIKSVVGLIFVIIYTAMIVVPTALIYYAVTHLPSKEK